MKNYYTGNRTRLYLALLALLFTTGFARAQYNLTVTSNYGNISPNYVTTDLITSGTQIIAGSLAANQWSAQQTLPFAFDFWGTAVSTYYVSANGVVTFASSTPASLPAANGSLPDLSLPDNSIAGMWDDFTNAPPTGSNDVVRVNTFGTAPNRQVWISWYSFETGNPNLSFAYWSIVLEETTNNIYVTDQYSNTGSSTGVTVGLQKDHSTAISDANSPNILAQGNGTALTDNDVWVFQYLGPPCSGAPAAGTTAGPSPVCPAASNTYAVTGGTIASAIAYQWQSSTDGVAWSDIASATNSTYVTTVPTAIQFRRRDVCTTTNDTVYSAPLSVAVNSFMNCYGSSIPTQTGDEEIYNVTVNGGSTDPLYAGTNGCSTVAPGSGSILNRYSNFTTLPAITSAAPGQTVSFSIDQDECDGATYYYNGIAIWIDFNQNGSLSDPGEQVFVESTTAQGPRTVTGSFTIPSNAVIGNTLMRVICAEGYSGASLTPLLSYSYGETEDHLFNVACPTLTGVTALNAGVCSGNTVTLNGTPSNALSTVSWWDAATGGTQIGAGSSFTSGTLTADTNFYAQEDFTNCPSTARAQVSVTVTAVDVTLVPSDATCNGLNDGTFNQTAVSCGTGPFEYSVDGGAFGPIPTDLVAGTYSVVVRDATTATSVPYQVIIGEPTAPTGLNAYNVTYYNGTLDWTPQGSESSWIIEYGPAGFTPGTGTFDTAYAVPFDIHGLDANTAYEFYVAAGCTVGSDFAGPFAFSTDPGFLAYDNQCSPLGFVEISGTGTNLNTTDDSEAGVTLPFSFNYQGTSVSTLTVGNNGGIQLNTLTGNVGYGGDMTFLTGDYLFPWGDDMDGQTGDVFWDVVGTAPNRTFIAEWQNLNNYFNGAGSVTFQVQIMEATSEIYFVYTDVVFGGSESGDDYAANADIGISGTTTDINVSNNNPNYLQNNSCVHFYYALCPNVTNISALIFQEEIDLDWNPGLYGETDWTIVYGPTGFDPATSGTTLTVNSSDVAIPNLDQLSTYDIYIYSECAADNLTSNGTMVTYTTLPYCADPTALSATTDVDSLEASWTFVPNPGFDAIDFNIKYGMTGFDVNSATANATGSINTYDTIMDPSFLAGGVYQMYVQAVCDNGYHSNYSGPYTFVMPVSNDTVCGSENLNADGTVYTFDNNGATVSLDEASVAPPATGAQTTTGWTNSTLNNTTWFTFQAPATGSVRINNTAINYNGQVAIYEVGSCGDFTSFGLVAANDNEIDGSSLAPNFTVCGLTPGATYYFMHDGFNGTTGNYSISIHPIDLHAGTANPVTEICTGTDIDLFSTVSANDAGGTWSSSIAAVQASINGSAFTSDGLAYTTFDFQYRVVDGCAYDSILTQVHIFGPSNAGQDGTITVCRNEPFDLLSGLDGSADLNGTWYNPSNQAIASSQVEAGTLNIPGQYNYDYIAGNGVCANDTANVVVTVQTCDWLGLDDQAIEGVSLYPNPSQGMVYISSGSSETFDFVVTDAKGRVVTEAKGGVKAAQTTEINLNSVETGVYFIRLSNTQAEKVFRVVIQ